jgi:hypothetical protein
MTSPPSQISVNCPQCGEIYQDWYRASVNLDMDDFDDDYLDQCSSATCPNCGWKVKLGGLVVRDGTFFVDDALATAKPAITEEGDLPAELREALLRLCNSIEWRKTTTYPAHMEHEYILRKNRPGIFAELSMAIDAYGHDESFFDKTYRYLILAGYRYWHFEQLVNRETMEKYLARHPKPISTSVSKAPMPLIRELLGYLPYFQNPPASATREVGLKVLSPGMVSLPYVSYSEAVEAFNVSVHRALELPDFKDFNWPDWQPTADVYCRDQAKLERAPICDLIRLLIMHVRMEHFCEGHLAEMINSGHIGDVLRCLQQQADRLKPID